MIKVDLNKECNCILDCVTTRYTYSLHTNKINAEELCSKKEYLTFMSSGTTGYPPKFIRRYEQIVYGKDIGDDVLCQNRTRNMAIVRFQIADQIITRIKKTQRMTFADFVSNIGTLHIKNHFFYLYQVFLFNISGGTLGLFSGISLISVAEFLFWIYCSFLKYFKTYHFIVRNK